MRQLVITGKFLKDYLRENVERFPPTDA